jgi:hypothetical protein
MNLFEYVRKIDRYFGIKEGSLIVFRLEDGKILELFNTDLMVQLNLQDKRFEIRSIKTIVENYICLAVLSKSDELVNEDDEEDIVNYEQVFYFLKYSFEDDKFTIHNQVFNNGDLVPYYDRVEFGHLKPKYQVTYFEPL